MEYPIKKAELTDRQRRFCEEYMKDLNITLAAIRAGYGEKNARSVGYHTLRNPLVRAYIRRLQGDITLEAKVTAKDIVVELARIAFANMRDFVDENNRLRKIADMPVDKSSLISHMRIIEVDTPEGKRTTTYFRLHDKTKALERLGRYLGLFNNEALLDESQPVVIAPE